MNYKAWLDNEYRLWAEALSESTVHNFREHPQVKRMLSEVDPHLYYMDICGVSPERWAVLLKIQSIGYLDRQYELKGAFIRMIYWALKVLKEEPKSICEIGGGVGEFYAILRVLGYDGTYYIYDLAAVKEFQRKFLREVFKQTGLNISLSQETKDFCVSFYALGEFDDLLKQWYIENVVNKCQHGLIIWNPHSGASEEININHELTIENLTDGSTKITW